jgi:hypothetical protein
MATKNRRQSKEPTSRRSEGTATRRPVPIGRYREQEEQRSSGREERLIGAERFPRKGDEDEEESS